MYSEKEMTLGRNGGNVNLKWVNLPLPTDRSEAYSEPYQRFKMVFFEKLVNGFQLLTFRKTINLKCLAGSEYASVGICSKQTARTQERFQKCVQSSHYI